MLLLNEKTIRLPSGDHTGNSATPAPSVSRAAPLLRDKSNSHRSAFVVSSGFVRDATARAPSGESVTLRKPPGSEARPDTAPCRSNQVSWESVSAVRNTRTSLAETEK